jgi:hypothetical protein
MRKMIAVLVGAGLTLCSTGSLAGADGTETLGPPSVPIANGTDIAVGGVGLFSQPASFTLTVPDDAVVKQVLLYHEAGHTPGDASGAESDHDLRVNGVPVQATRIGGPTGFYGNVQTDTHRVDVTALGLIRPGINTLVVDGVDVDEVVDGAGMLVVYEEPGLSAQLSVVDGNDIAFANFEPPRNTTVPQTFTFDAAGEDRVASLAILVGSVHDPAPSPNPSGNQKNRPNVLQIETGGRTTRLPDPLGDREPEWDSGTVDVTIPAGATSLTVSYLSEYDQTGDLPASLVWLAAGLSVPQAQPPPATTTPPPTNAPPTTIGPPPTTFATVPGQPGSIPITGSNSGLLLSAALGLLAAGATTLIAVRRRSGTAAVNEHDRI